MATTIRARIGIATGARRQPFLVFRRQRQDDEILSVVPKPADIVPPAGDDEHGVVGFEGRVGESRQKRGLALRVLFEADGYDAEPVVQGAQLRDLAANRRRARWNLEAMPT